MKRSASTSRCGRASSSTAEWIRRIAREMVLARLGDVKRLKRTCVDLGRRRDREMRLTQFIEELRADVTSAFRQMEASPGFTVVAVLTLALGIGANSAMFALGDAPFLRPLPFGEPVDRLVMLWEQRANGFTSMASPIEFREWNEHSRSFESMASFATGPRTMRGLDGTLEQVQGMTVSAKFFDVLGVSPNRGTHLRPGGCLGGPNDCGDCGRILATALRCRSDARRTRHRRRWAVAHRRRHHAG